MISPAWNAASPFRLLEAGRGREILVITPQSPLGAQLQGKKQGDRLQLTLSGVRDAYRVVSVE